MREGAWKLVGDWNRGWELYDVEADRTEQTDLARRHPEKVRAMSASYSEWVKRCGVEPWSGNHQSDS